MNSNYYARSLSAERLRRCYALAPARIQQYLAAEIAFVRGLIAPADTVLELGCGYGRIMCALSADCRRLIGIDTSPDSVALAKKELQGCPGSEVYLMDAIAMTFSDETMNLVLCLQNGISAFHVDQTQLLRETLRVTRRGGTAVFSTYSPKIWVDRLHWFEQQSEAGLIGEIDHEKSEAGVIVCKDGFTATTLTAADFRALATGLDVTVRIEEVDNSSIMCLLTKG